MIAPTGNTNNNAAPSSAKVLRDSAPQQIQDQVSLGSTPNADPALQGKPNFSSGNEPFADKKEGAFRLPMWMRVTTGGLAALTLGMSMTGCTRGGGPAPVPGAPETQQQREARQQLSRDFDRIEERMRTMQGGTGEQQANQVTRELMDAAQRYARASGKEGPGLVNDLRNLMVEHPALTFTTMFALGTAGGVGLEKLGLTDGISRGVSYVYQQAKEHPLIATGVVLGVAGGTAVLVHQLSSTEARVPAKPNTAEARTLDATFSSLEEQISANPNMDPKDVNRQVLDAVRRYQSSSGRPWEQVRDDVMAFAYEHPILAATAVTGAGVATGVVLERAGVPDKVAGLIGIGLDYGSDGARGLVQFAKDHPVVAGAVGAGVAAGVGYLAYQHFAN